MVFDLTQICCDSLSSSSSSSKIFCNENFNKCNPHCCHSCCGTSFLNDHTYSILKRVCHKIIKSYNRKQCCEKYTVFNGGNSIYHRCNNKHKTEGQTEYDKYRSGIKDVDNTGPLKTFTKLGTKTKEDNVIEHAFTSGKGKERVDENNKRGNARGKKGIDNVNREIVTENGRASEKKKRHDEKSQSDTKKLADNTDKEKDKGLDEKNKRSKKGNDKMDKEIVTENGRATDKKKRHDEKSQSDTKKLADNIEKEKEKDKGLDENNKRGNARGKKGIDNVNREIVAENGRASEEKKRHYEKSQSDTKKLADNTDKEKDKGLDEKNKRGNARGKKGTDNMDKEIVAENAGASENKKQQDEKSQSESKKLAVNNDKEKALTSDKEKGLVEKNKLGNAPGKKGKDNIDKERVAENTPVLEKEKGRNEKTESSGVRSKTGVDDSKTRKQGSGKKGGIDEENRTDKKNQNQNSEKKLDNMVKENGKSSNVKKGKPNLLDDIDLNAIPLSGKKSPGNNTRNEKAQVTKSQKGRKSEKAKSLSMDESLTQKKLGKKSNREMGSTVKENKKIKVDQKADKSKKNYVKKSNKGKNSTGELSLTHPSQYTGKQKPHRRESSKIRRSRIRNSNIESKISHNERLSSRKCFLTRRPCRGDEVRVSDILRVHLEDRDLSRCIMSEPIACQACRSCMPNCMPFVC